MASMNDLLNRFGVQPPEPEPIEPPEEPPKRNIQIGAAAQPTHSQTPVNNSAAEQPKAAKPRKITIHSAKSREMPSGEAQTDEAVSGVFGGGAGDETNRTPVEPRNGKHSQFWSTLPPLWGVDLFLMVISVVAVLGFLFNLPAVLLAMAKFVLGMAEFLLGLALIVGLGVIIVLVLRWRRRRRW